MTDTEYPASLFHAAGLTLRDAGFLKLNGYLSVMMVIMHYTVVGFVASPMADALVNMMPVPVDKVPFLVIAVLPMIASLCAIVGTVGVSYVASNGFENQHPRLQKAPGKGLPAWIDRLSAAQYNTFEACAYLICTFYVGASLGVPKLLFAKLASLFLALRVAYPVAYFLDIDVLRTQLWLTATYACLMVAFAGLFPESVLPMLGEVVKVKVR